MAFLPDKVTPLYTALGFDETWHQKITDFAGKMWTVSIATHVVEVVYSLWSYQKSSMTLGFGKMIIWVGNIVTMGFVATKRFCTLCRAQQNTNMVLESTKKD